MNAAFSTLARSAIPAATAAAGVRTMATTTGVNAAAYRLFFRRNPIYLAGIIFTAMVGGEIFEVTMDGVFNTINSGKLYHQVDWSKFQTDDE